MSGPIRPGEHSSFVPARSCLLPRRLGPCLVEPRVRPGIPTIARKLLGENTACKSERLSLPLRYPKSSSEVKERPHGAADRYIRLYLDMHYRLLQSASTADVKT